MVICEWAQNTIIKTSFYIIRGNELLKIQMSGGRLVMQISSKGGNK